MPAPVDISDPFRALSDPTRREVVSLLCAGPLPVRLIANGGGLVYAALAAIILIWGTAPYFASEPLELLGQTEFAQVPYDNYNLSMVGLSIGKADWFKRGVAKTLAGKTA